MSEEKKEGDCCSSSHGSSCCGGKKLIVGLLVIGLAFAAGMLFANKCPIGQKMCPMTGMRP